MIWDHEFLRLVGGFRSGIQHQERMWWLSNCFAPVAKLVHCQNLSHMAACFQPPLSKHHWIAWDLFTHLCRALPGLLFYYKSTPF